MAGFKTGRGRVKEISTKGSDAEAELLGKCNATYKSYNDGTFKYRRQWYLNDNFYDGKHFVWWRKSTGQIDRIQPPKGTALRSIPKASKQLDSIQNLILANDPKWVVYPDMKEEGKVDEAQDIAKRSSQWLEFKWDSLNMKQKVNDLVHYALKFPFSFLEVGFDTDIWVAVWDAFDIQFQPEATSIYDSPCLIKSINKNVMDIRNNPNYNENKDKVTPTLKYTPDEMKDLRMVEKFGYHRTKDEDESCVIKEYYFKEYIDTPNGKEIRIRIVTVGNDSFILRNELTDLKEYPFVLYTPRSGPLFQPAWIERIIPSNKSLDLIISNIETFFHIMNRGYWIKHKNANVSRVLNESGQFIEWDVVEPKQAQMTSIPNYVFAHIANLEKWIEEQSVSSTSTGRVPRGIKAYKAIEALKSSDVANMGTSITNLEIALEKCAEIMLDLAERFYLEPHPVYRLEEQKPISFNVMSSQNMTPESNATPLKASYKVDVQIESGLAYTEEGKRQTMLELFSMGLVPAEKVLEMFKFSNVGELIRDAQAEKQVSMIDTVDFQALDPQTKKVVLQELMQKNVTVPQTPMPQVQQFRKRENKKSGVV